MAKRSHKSRRRKPTIRLVTRIGRALTVALGVLIIGGMLAIVAMIVFARETRPGPNIGDHWHASYEIWVCGEQLPDIPQFDGGVHTHGAGLIHMHPHLASEEGPGAALGMFFEYGGYTLTDESLVVPDVAVQNGDPCDGGAPGQLRVFLNGEPLDNFVGYIPKDGDELRIEFAPDEASLSRAGVSLCAPFEQARIQPQDAEMAGTPLV